MHNGFSMHYDIWRFCTNLVLSCLRDVWQVLDRDLQQFLWDQCRFAGAPGSQPPTLTAQQHWCPFLLTGTSPEDLLSSQIFDTFRCDPVIATAHVVTFESVNETSPLDDEPYVRRRALCTRDNLLGTRRQDLVQLFNTPVACPLDACECGTLEALLQPAANNFALNAIGTAVLKYEHSNSQKAAFLYMELLILQRACSYFWEMLAETLHSALPTVPDDHIEACALLDALIVVLKADFFWIGRPTTTEAHVAYNQRVRLLLLVPEVRAVASSPLRCLPAHLLEDELLAPQTESDNQRFKPLLLNSIKRAAY